MIVGAVSGDAAECFHRLGEGSRGEACLSAYVGRQTRDGCAGLGSILV
ncbi:Uncharacterised protein [Nocardia asteroides]|nr:hypothetical protein SAMN05444423_102749 [Nocardia asteroides]VEG35964.1 Uncharacterised protein [Nocardia asteroides]